MSCVNMLCVGVLATVLSFGLPLGASAQTLWEGLDGLGENGDEAIGNLADGNCTASVVVSQALRGNQESVAELLDSMVNDYRDAARQLRAMIEAGDFSERPIPSGTAGPERVFGYFGGPPQTVQQILVVLADQADVASDAAARILEGDDEPNDILDLMGASANIAFLMGFLGEALSTTS